MSAISEPSPSANDPAEFDEFAENYDELLNRALAVSGEDKYFFALCRVKWLWKLFAQRNFFPERVLDYGCGTGTAVPFFFDLLDARSVLGVDVSEVSLEVARATHTDRPVTFLPCSEYTPAEQHDLAYCNGVFHHIPPAERPSCAEYVFQSLRPGGLFAFWENNPWNPGARYCMRVNPFDRDAIPLAPTESHRLLRSVGFDIVTTNYLFIFPKALSWFRWLEPPLCRVPCGAQYLILCQRRELH